jgi:hypothetical protein
MSQRFTKVIFLFLFSLLSTGAYAQYNYGAFNYYTLGVKAGYDIYSYSFDETQQMTYEVQPNFNFGVSGGLYLSYLLELHADFRYSIRNFNLKWDFPQDPTGQVPALSEYKMSYISVPVQLRLNAIYLKWVKLNIGVGLMPDFRLRPQETVTYQNGSTSESNKTYLTKNFAPVLIAVPMSANLKINFSRHIAIEFSGNYYYYLNKMHTDFMTANGTAIGFNAGFFYDW